MIIPTPAAGYEILLLQRRPDIQSDSHGGGVGTGWNSIVGALHQFSLSF